MIVLFYQKKKKMRIDNKNAVDFSPTHSWTCSLTWSPNESRFITAEKYKMNWLIAIDFRNVMIGRERERTTILRYLLHYISIAQ